MADPQQGQRFVITGMLTSDLQQTWLLAADGYFSIRGVVISQENGYLSVRIRRNLQVPLGSALGFMSVFIPTI